MHFPLSYETGKYQATVSARGQYAACQSLAPSFDSGTARASTGSMKDPSNRIHHSSTLIITHCEAPSNTKRACRKIGALPRRLCPVCISLRSSST